MGFEGAEVAGSCDLKYGFGCVQAGQLGIYKLKAEDLGLGVFRQPTATVPETVPTPHP